MDFLRRRIFCKFPISQPSILKRFAAHNRHRAYGLRVKPFGFVQSISPAILGKSNPIPIAPFEADLARSKRLSWVDYETGDALRLDWHGNGLEGSVPVMTLREYIHQYQKHPEAKAADRRGEPSGPDTIGLLHRLKLRSMRLTRIGKEVDRLDQNEGVSLAPEEPVEYSFDDLTDDIARLARFPQGLVPHDLGLSVRGWRNIITGASKPRAATAERIELNAMKRRQM